MNFVVVRCLLAAVLTALALPTQARVLEDCTTSSPGVPPPAIQDMSPAKRDARRSRARAAAGDVALTDEALAAYAALGLNTVFLDDTLGADVSDPLNLHWVHKSRERLAEELAICRKHNMSVILSLMTTDMPARWVRHYQPGVASPEPPRRTFGSARRRSVTSEPMVPGADEATIAARASLWAELDRGEIIYAFFVPDDVCLVQEPVEKQRRTYEIVKAHAPEIYVLGIMAEYTAFADEDLLRRCWDVRVADDWAMVDYPYDSSGLWTKQLNHLTSQEPDADHVAYQMLLVQMLSHCLKGATPDRQIAEAQRIILVPQVFYIEGQEPGMWPRVGAIEPFAEPYLPGVAGNDVAINSRLTHRLFRKAHFGADHASVVFFYLGGVGLGERGILDVPGYPEAVTAESEYFRLLGWRLSSGGPCLPF